MRSELSKTSLIDAEPVSGGWIARVRMALGISQTKLAHRLNVSKQAVSAMEERERSGSISVTNLRQVAEALGCRLEYRLVPVRNLEDFIFEQAEIKARNQLSRLNRSFELEDQALSPDDFENLVREQAHEYINRNDQSIWDEIRD